MRRLLVLALLAVLVPLAAPARAQDAATLRSLDFGDAAVRGMYGSAEFFVPLPQGVAPTGPASVDLVISHSPLLVPDRSTVTVVANGLSVASAFLTPDNANRGHITASVPVDLLGGEGVFLEARFFMRLTHDDCEETNNPGQWATVHADSTVTLPPTADRARAVREIPALVTGSGDQPVRMTLPATPSREELAAAGAVAATVGRWFGATHRDPQLTLDEGDGPTIAIGEQAGALAVSQSGPMRVDVGSRAVRTLADDGVLAGLDDPSVSVGAARAAALPARTRPWSKAAASFAQLGVPETSVTGPGSHTVDLQMERPPGWTITSKGHLDLAIDAGAGLRAEGSSVNASVNGTDIGSRRLQPGGGVHRYRFAVPAGIVDTDLQGRPLRALDLRLTLQLQPEQRACQPLDVAATRTTVLTTSSWRLPHGWYSGRDIGRFPQRLHDSQGNRAAVVVPADADDDTLLAALQLCAAIGRWAEPGLPAPLLRTARTLTSEERRTHSLVLLGDADAELGHAVDVGRAAVARGPDDAVAVLGLVASP